MVSLLVRGLRVERNGRRVLDGCDAEFPGRCRTVLWGRSGAGKSTLLNAIAGLLVPSAGSITLGERVLFSSQHRIDVAPHLRRVGYVFQDLALWPHLTALHQVALVSRSVGLGADDAVRLLASVGLDKLTDRRPAELSGGEQQRLAIARALAGKPTMLLLDEPFSAADPTTRASLHDLVRAASADISGPTIYVTHNADDARQLAERAVRMADGTLMAEERPWERGTD